MRAEMEFAYQGRGVTMMITHNEVAIGLTALICITASTGAGYFAGWLSRGPRARQLDEMWDQGHATGRDEGWKAGYAIGVDDGQRGLAYAYHQDGSPTFEPVTCDDAELPQVTGPLSHAGQPRGPQPDSAVTAASTQDWGDELSGMGVRIALDDATDVLAATPPQPAQSDAWEYRLAEWIAGRDRWLAGQRAETAEWCAARGIEHEEARTA